MTISWTQALKYAVTYIPQMIPIFGTIATVKGLTAEQRRTLAVGAFQAALDYVQREADRLANSHEDAAALAGTPVTHVSFDLP